MTDIYEVCETLPRWLTADPESQPGWSSHTWGLFCRASVIHGIAPLLYTKIGQLPWIPDQVREWLERQYTLNVRRIAKMQEELHAILASFSHHQVPIMPLKGSILGPFFYSDPGLRPMADLDFLLRPADFEAGEALFHRLGYEESFRDARHLRLIKPDNREVVETGCEHPDNPRLLEVHPWCGEDIEGAHIDLTDLMWANASYRELLGENTWIVNIDILWLHLFVHMAHHILNEHVRTRLIHLLDLEMLTPLVDNPQEVLASIDARGIYPGLALLHRYFPTPRVEALLASQRERVEPAYAGWAHSLNLVNASHLARELSTA